jgi:hypothetical protein
MAIDADMVLVDLKAATEYYQSLSMGPEDRSDVHAKLLRDAATLIRVYRNMAHGRRPESS